MKWIVPLALLAVFSTGASAQNNDKDSVDVMHAAETFVKAFSEFDWPVFQKSFADDATIFMPFWANAKRLNGRAESDSVWLRIFPMFSNPDNEQTMHLDPQNIDLQLLGDAAIVTFHLGDGVRGLGRRTAVFAKRNGEWKMVHLHASNLMKPEEN